MATFIKPNVVKSHRDYIGEELNHPVNIELCTEIIKEDEDDGYGTKYAVIHFEGCNVTWWYGEIEDDGYAAQERDKQHKEILEKFRL